MIAITTSNCNYHLTRLYKERDQIGESIDKFVVMNRPDVVAKLEQEYQNMCDVIDEFLEFRRNNPGCALEGDPNYGPL